MVARKRDAKGHFIKESAQPAKKEQSKAEPPAEEKQNVGLVMGNKGAQGSK